MTKFKVGDLVEITSKEYNQTVRNRPGIIIRLDNDWPENHILHLHVVYVNGTEVPVSPADIVLIE
jgi:hypothetical protein